jgi:hypothetical protein
MDGYTLSRDVRELLNEESTSLFINAKNTYDYLYEAAIDLNSKIKILTDICTLTSVDGTQEYELPADFSGLHLQDSNGQYYIKVNDGTNDYTIFKKDYEFMYNLFDTTETNIPSYFAIKDCSAFNNRITGTASLTSASTTTNECTLTDTSSTTKFSVVSVGDTVHNITDTSHGVIIEKTSDTALVTCLFEGNNNDWTANDTYYIIPQGRMSIIFDKTSATSGYTIYVPYIQKPTPVYSLFKTYRFDNVFRFALVKYAAWLYKYRDREPNYGDGWYKYYDEFIRKQNANLKTFNGRNKYKVYMKKY